MPWLKMSNICLMRTELSLRYVKVKQPLHTATNSRVFTWCRDWMKESPIVVNILLLGLRIACYQSYFRWLLAIALEVVRRWHLPCCIRNGWNDSWLACWIIYMAPILFFFGATQHLRYEVQSESYATSLTFFVCARARACVRVDWYAGGWHGAFKFRQSFRKQLWRSNKVRSFDVTYYAPHHAHPFLNIFVFLFHPQKN